MAELVTSAGERGVLARGLGRSYGDPAQNAGGQLIDLTEFAQLLSFDAQQGIVTVQAGMSIETLLSIVVPAGWFIPVTPGTARVTLGGAAAADVHGKNHHRDGSLARHVNSLQLVLADGSISVVTPDSDPELFWGTMGGMGLTGVILAVTLQLIPITTPAMSVDTERAGGLDELVSLLVSAEQRHRYSVAWIDCLASGRRAGRGIVTSGEHAGAAELASARAKETPRYAPRERATAPTWVPPGLLNRGTITAFNEAWFRAARPQHGALHSISSFFHPLDAVAGWNRLYGPRGFLQYQCVVPDETTVRAVLARISGAKVPSFLAVLKRFGPATPGPLSFPRNGWTLAFDIPAATDGLDRVLDQLDELVAESHGSVYLAKDSRMRPELLATFYPQLPAWHALRDRIDPNRTFRSDQSRRLSL